MRGLFWIGLCVLAVAGCALSADDEVAPGGSCAADDHKCITREMKREDRESAKAYVKAVNSLIPNEIMKLQNPKNCKTAKIMQYTLGSQGMMAIYRNTAICFMAAIKMGRTFVTDGGMGYYIEHDSCKGNGYRCFFHPESSCTRKDWTAKEEVRLDQLVMEHSARVITTDVVQCRLMITDDNVNYTSKHITSEAWNRFLPTEYKEEYNLFEYVSMLELYLLRPSPLVAGHIQRLKREINYPEGGKGVISIHVRHGDKARENGVNFTYAEYYEKALELHAAFGIPAEDRPHSIFLASDDKKVIEDAEEIHERTCKEGSTEVCLRLMRMPANSLWMDGIAHHGALMGAIRARTLPVERFPGREVVTDILTLSQGEFLIGTCTSGVSSVAASLMVASRGGHKGMRHLPIRMDGRYCWASQWFADSNTGGWADTVTRP